MNLANGVAVLQEVITQKLTAKTARIEKIEMVDSATGDIYCTWIANGEWQKVKGECAAVAVVETPALVQEETPVPVQQPAQSSVLTEEIVQQVTQQPEAQAQEQIPAPVPTSTEQIAAPEQPTPPAEMPALAEQPTPPAEMPALAEQPTQPEQP